MTTWPAAAATGIADLFAGPTVTGRVVARRSAALLVELPGAMVAVVGPRGGRTPHTLVVGAAAFDALSAPPGTAVTISGPRVQIGGDSAVAAVTAAAVTVARWWDSAVPRITPCLDDWAGGVVGVVGGLPAGRLESLRSGLRHGRTAAAAGVLGLGPGSTPSGDDVLAGLFTALHATGRGHDVARIAAALPDLAGATTVLSADLLRLAVRGHACAEVLSLLRALDRRDPLGSGPGPAAQADRIEHARRAVLALGHTSGADLILGLHLGLTLPRTVFQHPAPLERTCAVSDPVTERGAA